MPLRINNNPTAINTRRNLIQNQDRLLRSLEKLSSGSKVNRASDGAAALIISEQMRAQISGIKQAIDNSETAVGMVQTAEGALNEINTLLIKIRQRAVHAANEGANDEVMLQANQFEIDNALDTIDRITFNTQFGLKRILDGSQAANGVTNGEALEFVAASPKTKSSPVEGYEVRVHALGSRARAEGSLPLSQELVEAGEELTIAESGRTVSFRTTPGDTVDQAIGKLRREIEQIGLDVNLMIDEDGRLILEHNKFGSEFGFSVASTTAGVLSSEDGLLEVATPGRDIWGTIGDRVAFGRGQLLTGGEGTPVEGLQVRYQGTVTTDPDAGEGAEIAGRVAVFQNSLVFQVGGNMGQTVAVSLNSTNTRTIGRGVLNASGFRSLRNVNVLDPQKAQDTQRIVDQAVNEVTRTRAELGAFQKNTFGKQPDAVAHYRGEPDQRRVHHSGRGFFRRGRGVHPQPHPGGILHGDAGSGRGTAQDGAGTVAVIGRALRIFHRGRWRIVPPGCRVAQGVRPVDAHAGPRARHRCSSANDHTHWCAAPSGTTAGNGSMKGSDNGYEN